MANKQKAPPTAGEVRREVCAQFVKRSAALGLKGKARDRAAIEFLVGAAAFAVARFGEKSPEWCALSSAAFMVSIRGYAELEHLANSPLTTKEAA